MELEVQTGLEGVMATSVKRHEISSAANGSIRREMNRSRS